MSIVLVVRCGNEGAKHAKQQGICKRHTAQVWKHRLDGVAGSPMTRFLGGLLNPRGCQVLWSSHRLQGLQAEQAECVNQAWLGAVADQAPEETTTHLQSPQWTAEVGQEPQTQPSYNRQGLIRH